MANPWLAALAGGLSGFNDWRQEDFQKKRLLEQDTQRRLQLQQQEEDRALMREIQGFQALTQRENQRNTQRKEEFDQAETLFNKTQPNEILADSLLARLGPFKDHLKTGQTPMPLSGKPLTLPGKAFALEAPSGGELGFATEIPDAGPLTLPGKTFAGLGQFGTFRAPNALEQKGLREEEGKLTQEREFREAIAAAQKQFANDPQKQVELSIGAAMGPEKGSVLLQGLMNDRKPASSTTDFGRYLQTAAAAAEAKKGGPLDPQERQQLELQARKEFYQADDQPRSGGVPLVVQGLMDGEPGFYQVTRGGTPSATRVPNLTPMPTAEQRNRQAMTGRSTPVVDALDELSARINTLEGVMASAAGVAEKTKAKVNLANDTAEYLAVMDSFIPMVARAFGHTGVLTQQDVDSVKSIFPKPGDSKSLRDRKITRLRSILEGGTAGGPRELTLEDLQ